MIGAIILGVDAEPVSLVILGPLGDRSKFDPDAPGRRGRHRELVRELAVLLGGVPDLPLHAIRRVDGIVALAFEEPEGQLLADGQSKREERLLVPGVDDPDRLGARAGRDVGERRVAADLRPGLNPARACWSSPIHLREGWNSVGVLLRETAPPVRRRGQFLSD